MEHPCILNRHFLLVTPLHHSLLHANIIGLLYPANQHCIGDTELLPVLQHTIVGLSRHQLLFAMVPANGPCPVALTVLQLETLHEQLDGPGHGLHVPGGVGLVEEPVVREEGGRRPSHLLGGFGVLHDGRGEAEADESGVGAVISAQVGGAGQAPQDEVPLGEVLHRGVHDDELAPLHAAVEELRMVTAADQQVHDPGDGHALGCKHFVQNVLVPRLTDV
mmetsp:Transcript_127308/g.220315  ORF Transcript_127308/g.220315 Transcript_127308/m.220315 type:complete len:220 (+) Transcript_127308:4321-4980(+)